MPSQVNGMADTIRILVATDNHVGYNERDPIRGDDSWKTFHEIMCLAKDRDVDMVLLGGDLFHDNVPSRKSLYNVMRSLRLNCYGEKPCEIELLSDGTELFDANIGHANYEDTNINVAIPVFSIHGNHDDPSGDGHFAALDILEMSGLINYFGRVPQSDKIVVKPLLLQKGSTKLAVFGLSNVRDERLYRTFKDGNVEMERPTVQTGDWFNIAVVHQNHHAHGPTSYLPENFLHEFLDLVIWGHEHECDIEPRTNAEMGFQVMQPGSSVATSLALGEAVQKKVAILSITGREMKSESIRLKTVRPFVYKEIVLSEEKEVVKLAEKHGYQTKLTQWLMGRVEELIAAATRQWLEAQEADPDYDASSSPVSPPLPLIRLRVEHSTKDHGRYEVENPQRFSNRFSGRVANSHDVIQFHIKKRNAAAGRLKATEELRQMMSKPEDAENVKVAKLVQEFLAAQALTILPQNCFGDAVNQYIDKDDKHAMDLFINDSLVKQVRHLVSMNQDDEEIDENEDLIAQFDAYRAQMEEMFKDGQLKNRKGSKVKYKPKPDDWNSDLDGDWEDQPGSMIVNERDSPEEAEEDDEDRPKPARTTRGRGRGRGRGTTTSTGGRGGAAAKNSTTTKSTTAKARGKKKAIPESEEEDEDVIMVDDDEDDEHDTGFAHVDDDSDSQAMFFPDTKKNGKKATASALGSARGSRAGSIASTSSKPAGRSTTTATRKTPARAAAGKTKQSQLSFTTSQASVFGGRSQRDVSDIEDEDDEDAFEPARPATKRKR